MSNIPESTLQMAIVQGLRAIRQDPKVLGSVFKNEKASELDQIRNFFLTKSIEFSVNYPRGEELKIPAIILTMQSDVESDPVLGDFLGNYAPQEMYADTLGGHGASISTISGLNTKIIGNIQVNYTEEDPLTGVNTLYWNSIFTPEILKVFAKAPSQSYTIHVINGYGAGQKHKVTRIRSNSLDIAGSFSPQLDTSSYIDIRKTIESEHSDGQASRLYTEDAPLVQKGSIYEARYALNVLGSNQSEVIFLYAAIKTILLSQRKYLEDQGLQGLTIQGAEFSPKGEYLPNVVYGRSVNLTFKYPFSYVEELPTYSAIDFEVTTNHTMFDPCTTTTFRITI